MRGLKRELMRGLICCFEHLELDTAERLGAALGSVCYYLGLRRRVVARQLRDALGHLSAGQRRAAARRSYAQMGANFIHVFATKDAAQPFGAGWQMLNPQWAQLLGKRYPGAVYVSPHVGAFEVHPYIILQYLPQENIVCYARQQKDPSIDAALCRHRILSGAEIRYVRDQNRRALFHMCASLKRGERSLSIVADQGPRPQQGLANFFLGQATYVHHGPYILAKRAAVPIIPCFTVRVGVAQYRCFCGRPIAVQGRAMEEVVQLYMDQLSAMVAAFPGQYFWHHRRFKYAAAMLPRSAEPWRIHGLRLLLEPSPVTVLA